MYRYQFLESAILVVFNIKREWLNKVFDGISATVKGFIGCFLGFKLYLIINDKGEKLIFALFKPMLMTENHLKNGAYLKVVFEKLYAD